MKVLEASGKLAKKFVAPFKAKITADYDEVGNMECTVHKIYKSKSYGGKWCFSVSVRGGYGSWGKFDTPAVLVDDDFDIDQTYSEQPKTEERNPVIRVLDDMTNAELRKAAKELFNWHKTCILVDGVIRKYAALLKDGVGIPSEHTLQITERYVLERCTRGYLFLSGSEDE